MSSLVGNRKEGSLHETSPAPTLFDFRCFTGLDSIPGLRAAPFYGGNVLQTERASDPWVSIGPDGTAYTVSISFDENTFKNGVGAATSSDGGVSWQNQKFVDLKADVGPFTSFDDKESTT